ncbi:MAG: lysX [Humibacillus sp.]|nr:lysX [Humibacillus sp.]
MGRLHRGEHAPHRAARLLTGTYAVATVAALVLTVGGRHGPRPAGVEEAFGLVNVPVAPTIVSVVTLGLTTRALLGRKRVGLWLVAAFQVLGIALGVVELLRAQLPLDELWESRGSLGLGLDVAAMLVAVVALWWLRRVRDQFTGRLQRGSWWVAAAALVGGSAVTAGVTWLLIGAVGAPRSQLRAVVAEVLAALGGIGRRPLGFIPPWVTDVVAVMATITILGATLLFVASARPRSRWSPDRELALRRLLAEHGADDSLGYFATRRDKSSVFSPDGSAAITYRVIGGVSLASGDPIGRPEAWAAAIDTWRAEAREFGWVPASLAASERGARAYAAAGMQVLLLGDEAILDPGRFDLRRASLSAVRHGVKRARNAGLVVEVRRQSELPTETLRAIAAKADSWRDGSVERGFSMALGRTADPSDARVVHVTATDASGAFVALLSFVPWGRAGLSLDLMRRAPGAPSGVNELMVTELLDRAPSLGVRQVSLNFCLFRGVFDDADRIGSRPLNRLNASVLGLFDRFWQLERLYRSTQKFEPAWLPRFLCHDDAVALPQVLVAAGAAEGFLPHRHRRTTTAVLGADQLRAVARLEEATAEAVVAGPRRSDQFAHRLTTLERLRASGADAWPVGAGAPSTSVEALASSAWQTDRLVDVVGRVREVRDHGGVVFATLVEGAATVQLLLDAAVLGRDTVTTFTTTVDAGDLVRVVATTGTSRTGTPSLLVSSWRTEAKSLHPVPFGALTDPAARARQRSTDLLVHPEALELLRTRSRVVAAVRSLLVEEGYLEVETPILQTVHGGASARPFRTYINAYGMDLTLRIAPELYLKRLVVAGIGAVFELGRNFRNEGADATHNPEFTSLEVYQPHGDYTSMRHLAERIVRRAAREVHGDEVVPMPTRDTLRAGPRQAPLADVSGEWPVVTVLDAVSSAVGRRVDLDTDVDVLLGLARDHDIAVRPEMGPGAVIEELYAELVEPVTMEPTFYTDFPVETSPLTHPHRSAPGLVERWDLVIAGVEVGTAYSELTDPIDQRARLTEQSRKAAAGDVDAMAVDEDFLQALELGMPPTGGLGIGIDRLVMLLTNTAIRSVLTFPFVRPADQSRTPAQQEVPSWS